MRILLSGSEGLVGSALTTVLNADGHTVVPLVRTPNPTIHRGIAWNPPSRGPDPDALTGIDAVVHLSGAPIAGGRWTAARKKLIMDSRVTGTLLLSQALAKMTSPAKVLVSASAIGYYGDRGNEALREDSLPGEGFLPDVCKRWEAATAPAIQKGLRVVLLRIGIVLSPRGGALKAMAIPFRFGVGGRMGSGRQVMSWIALDDLVSMILFTLKNESARGVINAVAPRPVTNQEFTETLGRVLHRPTFCSVPAAGLRLLFGEMADELLLASIRVVPRRLQDLAFSFRYPMLEPTLRHLLLKES